MLVDKLEKLPNIKKVPNVFALDFETHNNTHIIKGFSFAFKVKDKIYSYYCPISHIELEYYSNHYGCENLPKKEAFNYLTELIKDRTVVFHNAEFDTIVLINNKIKFDWNKIEDTMLMHYLLDTERLHGLKSIMREEYKIDVITYNEAEISDFKKFAEYAESDAIYTLRLYYDLLKEMDKYPKTKELYRKYELPFIQVLQSMNYYNNGIAIDFKLLSEYNKMLNKEIEITLSLLKEILGDINFNSSRQLGDALKKHNYKLMFTEKGNYALGEKELIMLKKKQGGKIIDLILYYRMLNKLKTTYVEPYINNLIYDGNNYLLSGYDFSHIGTRTGRLSSHNPNLQNQPRDLIYLRIQGIMNFSKNNKIKIKSYFLSDEQLKKVEEKFGDKFLKNKDKYSIDIRKIFIPKKGYKFIGADFSQIELRMAACLSNDKIMIEAFNKGIDVHQQTAEKINEILKSDFTRQQAKAVNFGILYGLYYNSLSEQTGLSLKDAKILINAWWNLYKDIKKFVIMSHITARKTGFATTLLGRRRNIKKLGLGSGEFRLEKYAENATISHIVSGSSADLIKVAMLNIYNKHRDNLIIKLQIHDELLIEVKEDKANEYLEIVKKEMENALKLNVKIEANAKIGNNWREVH